MVIDECDIEAFAIINNDTIVVVGGKPLDPRNSEMTVENSPPAGAIVNLGTKTVRSFTNGHKARILCIAVAADGSRVFTVSSQEDTYVRVWDTKAAKQLDSIAVSEKRRGNEIPCSHEIACFSSGRRFAVTRSRSVVVIESKKDEKMIEFTTELTSPGHLAIDCRDNLLACSSRQNDILIWDLSTGKQICKVNPTFPNHNPQDVSIRNMVFTKDSKQLIVARMLHVGDPAGFEVPKGSDEAKVSAERRGLALINIAKQEVIPLAMGHQNHTSYFALHPSEEWLATVGWSRRDADPNSTKAIAELRVYQFPSCKLARWEQLDEFTPDFVGFSPNGQKVIAISTEGRIRCWDFSAETK